MWVQRAGSLRDAHPMALNTDDRPRGWGGPRWEVLDREGRYLGTVDLPARFRLMEIRSDTILGVQADRCYGYRQADGDIDGLPGFYLECKNAKTHQLGPWLDLAARQAGPGRCPLLLIKRRGIADPGSAFAVTSLREMAHLLVPGTGNDTTT